MKNTKWYIWSIEHGAWWKPNRCGYTAEKSLAGTYSLSDALEIVKSANIANNDMPNEAMILASGWIISNDELPDGERFAELVLGQFPSHMEINRVDETDKCYLINDEYGHLTCSFNHTLGAKCLMDDRHYDYLQKKHSQSPQCTH